MRNLYKPVRYNVASIQAQQTLGGDCMESNENGIWVEFRDYLRLLEDYKSLQEWKRDADAETLEFDNGDIFAEMTLPERIKYIVESHARLRSVAEDNKTECEATRIENARLKAEVERLQSIHSIDSIGIEQLKAEVERLTQLNATISLRYDATKSMLDGCAKEIEEMEAEVERLTKAGDLMCRMAGNNQVINRHWKTAKGGKQS